MGFSSPGCKQLHTIFLTRLPLLKGHGHLHGYSDPFWVSHWSHDCFTSACFQCVVCKTVWLCAWYGVVLSRLVVTGEWCCIGSCEGCGKWKWGRKVIGFLQTSLLSAFSLLLFVSFPFDFVRTRICSRERKNFAGEMGWEVLSLWKGASAEEELVAGVRAEPQSRGRGMASPQQHSVGLCRAQCHPRWLQGRGGTEPPSSCLAPCSLWLSALRCVMTLGVWHLCCTGL